MQANSLEIVGFLSLSMTIDHYEDYTLKSSFYDQFSIFEVIRGFFKKLCYERLSRPKNNVCLNDFVHKYFYAPAIKWQGGI